MSNKNKALTALKRKKFTKGGATRTTKTTADTATSRGPGSPGWVGPVVNPLDDIKIDDPAKNSLAIQPEPFEVTADKVDKVGLAFNNKALDKILAQKSLDATYDPETGNYSYNAFGNTFEVTPEYMALQAGYKNLSPFMGGQSFQTQNEDISKLAEFKDDETAVDTKAAIGASATEGTATTSSAAETKGIDYGVPEGFTKEYIPFKGSGKRSAPTPPKPPEGKIYIYDKATGAAKLIDEPGAATYAESKVEESDFVTATGAKSDEVLKEAKAGTASLTERAKAPDRDAVEEKKAMSIPAADRSKYKEYADADTSKDVITVGDVTGPTVETRTGITILPEERARLSVIAQGRGVALEDLQEYQDLITTKQRKAQTGKAAVGKESSVGMAPKEREAEAAYKAMNKVTAGSKQTIDNIGDAGAASRKGIEGDAAAMPTEKVEMGREQAAVKDRRTFTTDAIDDATTETINPEDLYSFDPAQREAKSGEFAKKRSNELGVAPEEVAAQTRAYGVNPIVSGSDTTIENVPSYKVAATRQAQTGEAAQRIASELGDAPSVDLEGRRAITGEAPQGNAAQIGGIPTAAAATMQAVQGKTRNMAAADMAGVVADLPPDLTAAISEDPASVEAAIDSGADPQVNAAVAALPQEALVSVQMENLLAGMEDGKTPAWARPAVAQIEQMMAQRGMSASTVGRDALFNAIIQSALPMAQSNAQALQQRAQQNLSNEQQANLAESQQIMQVRMQNLANTQTAASQTAQMAQEIAVQQGAFKQQAVITESQQAQEARMGTAQFEQQRAQQESAQRQQAAVQTLSAEAQIDLANLQAESTRAGKQLDADQQARMATYQAQISKVMRKAELEQDMEKANLSPSLQIEMQRISELNAAAKDTMTAEQTERLTDLQTLIDFRKTDAQFAQQMDMANMSNEQQINLANLQEKAATDSANMTEANKFELSRLNNVVARNVRQAELKQDMEKANLSTSLQTELAVLQEKGITNRADMSSEQQMRLANLQNLVDFKKTDVAMAQQMDLAEMSNEQQVRMAELADKIATDSANVSSENQLEFTKLQTYAKFMSQNAELLQQTELANFSNEEKFALADLSSKNQASSENLSAEQQTELANLDAKLKEGTLNAQMRQQVITQDFSQRQQMELANLEALLIRLMQIVCRQNSSLN